MKLFPHPVLSEDHVEWGAWRVVTTDSSDVLSDHLKGWDFQQELHIQVECHLNVSGACQQLGVEAEELVLLATADCPATSRRFIGTVQPDAHATVHQTESDYEKWESWLGAAGHYYVGYWEEGETWAVTDSVDVVLEEAPNRAEALVKLRRIDSEASESWQLLTCDVVIPRESVAKSLDMSVQFIVRPTGEGGAHGMGARVLLGPNKRSYIEGDGARFPTEPVSFKMMTWPPSLWRLEFSFDSPDDSFGGAARLFVNTDHPASASLLDPQQSGGDLTRAFLRLGIVRTVIMTLARESRSNGGALSWDPTDEMSVAGVADAMAREWLRRDLEEAVRWFDRAPDEFEAQLQATALDLPKKVFA